MVNFHAVATIANANFQWIQTVQHVELGERDPVDPANLHRLAHHYRIKPAAAAASTGNRPEFVAAFAQNLSGFVILFGRKRAAADTRGIGLRDP